MTARLDPEQRAALRSRVERARESVAVDAIPRRADSGPASLSFAQQRLWFLDQLVPGNPFYNIPAALPLRLAIDEAALRRALAEIVRRHAALRTRFVAAADGPLQVVGEAYDPMAATIDLTAEPAALRQQRLDRVATEEARAPFDLAQGRLVRARLVRQGAAEQVLLLTMHHIVSDGWSMGVFFRELMQLYDAFRRGLPSPLPELPLQYADYAVWQRRMLSPQRLRALLAHWRQQLAGAPTLQLQTDRPRPPMASFRGAFLDVAIELPLTEALEALARAHEATLFQVLLAAFKAVLARFSGQTDVVVGAPIANRTRPEIESLIGCFVNSLVLRTDLAGDPGFAESLARVRRTAIAAYEHQDLPFEKLVEELQPERDMSRNPLAQVTFQIQNAPGALREKPEGLDRVVHIDRATAIFDLAFSLWETRNGLVGGIEYATDIFDAATVQGLVDALQAVLRAVVADPVLPLSRLPLVTPERRAALQGLLNGPIQAVPTLGLFEAFRAAAEAAPDEVVLADEAGEVRRAELLAQARALAGAMAARGVRTGAIVALALPRGRRFVALMLAALDAGAVWMPVDPAMPAARVQRMLQAAAPQLVLREGDPLVDALFADRSHRAPACAAAGDAAAYVLFTSGSTGRPKGVVVSHGALMNHMAWMRAELPLRRAGARVLQRTPLHFDASVWELWAPLLGDGVLLLPEPFEAADTDALAAAVQRHAATVLQIVPSLLRLLLDDPGAGRCRTLQRLCIGGEALGGELVAKVRQRWPGLEIVNLYGPTEATIDATWWVATPDWPVDAPVPVGRPVWNTRISVRDAAGAALPPGIVGELWIAGAALANGYLGADAAEVARFVTTADGVRHYRSGDLGWARHDGLLFCAGRLDLQVKVRGNRIELGDVEAALQSHPSVQAAVALAVAPTAEGAEAGGRELVAFVTVDAAAASFEGADARALERSHVAEWQALYQTVYEPAAAMPADSAFDTAGWLSSYDGRPIAAAAMREWLDATLERLRALRPRRVLEVGCGAGMIVAGLAPRCQRYLATDFSAPALDRARRALERQGGAGVRLQVCAAHELATLGEQGFDLAILNSVIQYFPGLPYLVAVLRSLQRLLVPGGRVFLGDVRHHGLAEAFHADVQAHRAGPQARAVEVLERTRVVLAQDKELLVAPAFFWRAGAEALPGFGRAAVRLKRGRVASEMLAFRYDVVLEWGAAPAPPALSWHDWRRGGLALERLGPWLRTQTAPLGLWAIPNARVVRAAALASALVDAPAGAALATVLTTAESRARDAVDPEALACVVAAAGWTAELLPSPTQADEFVAVLHQGTLGPFDADAAVLARRAPVHGRVASNPLLATIGPALERMLRSHLAELLPLALVPTRIEPLAELPLLPNGKADRQALALLASARRRAAPAALAPPDNALEALIAQTVASVLRLERVGVDDHFFNDLGGHSLLATQVISRLRATLEMDIALRLLFEHPTVRALAQALVQGPGGTDLERLAELLQEVASMDEAALDAHLAQQGSGP